jgi:epsilon-lactone hydrolase
MPSLVCAAVSGGDDIHSRRDVEVSDSLSLAARILGAGTRVLLRPLLRGGLAPRRRLLALVGVVIGQRAAGTRVHTTRLGSVAVEIATPTAVTAPASIVYLHGGAYVAMSVRSHRRLVTHLAAATGCRVISVDYRLAPEHPYPAALEDAIAVYTSASKDRPDEEIVLAGDSAGGGLALATALALRDLDVATPVALILIAPWIDLTCSGASMQTCARTERVLYPAGLAADARRYAGSGELASPLVSPLFADLDGSPPLMIQVGAHEILLDDSVRLADRAEKAGVPVNLQVWQRLWHDWHLYAGLLAEADAAIGAIADFVSEHIARRY